MTDAILDVTDETLARALSIDELAPGQSVRQHFRFDAELLETFGRLARDRAPVHIDPEFARERGFDAPIVQGLALATRFSRLIGMYLPGERAVLETIELRYRRPVYADRDLLYSATVQRVFRPMRAVTLALCITDDAVPHVDGHARCRLL